MLNNLNKVVEYISKEIFKNDIVVDRYENLSCDEDDYSSEETTPEEFLNHLKTIEIKEFEINYMYDVLCMELTTTNGSIEEYGFDIGYTLNHFIRGVINSLFNKDIDIRVSKVIVTYNNNRTYDSNTYVRDREYISKETFIEELNNNKLNFKKFGFHEWLEPVESRNYILYLNVDNKYVYYTITVL